MSMCLNARSLCIEKSDELLAVYVRTTLVAYGSQRPGLSRTCRRNLSVRQGFVVREKTALKKEAGVACYVAETIPYERLHDLEEDGREVIWLKTK